MYQGFGNQYGVSPYSQMSSLGLGQSPYSQMSALNPFGQSSLSQLGGNDLYSDRTSPFLSRDKNLLGGFLSQGLKSTQNEDRLMQEKAQRNLLKRYLTQATGDPIQSSLISNTIPGKGALDDFDVGLGSQSSILNLLGGNAGSGNKVNLLNSLGRPNSMLGNLGTLGSLASLAGGANNNAGLLNSLGGLAGSNTNNSLLGNLGTLGSLANLAGGANKNAGLLNSLGGLAGSNTNNSMLGNLGTLGSLANLELLEV